MSDFDDLELHQLMKSAKASRKLFIALNPIVNYGAPDPVQISVVLPRRKVRMRYEPEEDKIVDMLDDSVIFTSDQLR